MWTRNLSARVLLEVQDRITEERARPSQAQIMNCWRQRCTYEFIYRVYPCIYIYIIVLEVCLWCVAWICFNSDKHNTLNETLNPFFSEMLCMPKECMWLLAFGDWSKCVFWLYPWARSPLGMSQRHDVISWRKTRRELSIWLFNSLVWKPWPFEIDDNDDLPF